MRKLLLPLFLSLSLLLTVSALLSSAAPAAPLHTLHSGHHFLPPYTNPCDRFGFDSGALTSYDVAQLHAGWYSDWGARLNPAHPDGLTYVQLIRFHAGADPHDPAQVTVTPSREIIAQIAAAHPGSLWFMSNEPDSVYQGDPILPEIYAIVYHDFYTYIKGLDPAALIANGGIVQPTPCRLEYLDIVWDTHQQTYGEPMPVDVWNIHAFILREVYGSWGASTPPGVDPGCAIDYPIRDGDSVGVLRNNLIAMRQWMKDKGEQNKPLIISEYGVLWPDWFADEDGRTFPPARVSHFMTQTFDLFLNETYPDIGYPEDDYRLVQVWSWYSLSDDQDYNGYLFHSDSKQISPMGQTYAAYTAALADAQAGYTDLTTQLRASLEPLEHLTPTVPYETLTTTIPLTGAVANLGQVPATGAVIGLPLLGFQLVQDVPARYEEDVALLPLPMFVITEPGAYNLSLVADPNQAVADVRRWNDDCTLTVDARPDLLISTTTWSIQPPGAQGDVLNITSTVANSGLWPSPPASGTLYLNNVHGTPLLPAQRFSIPALGSGAQVAVAEELILPASSEDIYRLALEVDSDGVLDEQDEDNNQVEMTIPVIITTTLKPDAAAMLTSTSGRLAFLFPAGTVSRPTEIRFTPRMPSELPPGPLIGITAFTLATYQGGQPLPTTPLLPITVTWQYTDTDVAGLDEDGLGLYRMAEDNRWQRVSHPAQQRQPEVNRLSTCIQQLGEHVFGQGYALYMPISLASAEERGPEAQWPTPGVHSPQPPQSGGEHPGLPLRLPPWVIPMSKRPPRFHSLQQNSRHFALDRQYFDTLLAQNLGGLRWR